jgi:hypothetical protein
MKINNNEEQINNNKEQINKPEQIIKNILFFNEIKVFLCESQREIQWVDDLYNDFINSIFEFIPTGQIILNYISNKDSYQIIDGQHRINIICDFINNKKKFKNKFYSELNNSEKEQFNSTNLFTVIYKDLNNKQIMKLYLTINSGIDQDENHITHLLGTSEEINSDNIEINSINTYQDLIKYNKQKYVDIDDTYLLKIINIISYVVYDYDEKGINGVRFTQLSKAHFKVIINKINLDNSKDKINIIIKMFNLIYLIIKDNKYYSNNIYTFLAHRLYIDFYPEFNFTILTNYKLKKFIENISIKNNITLNELFNEYNKQ